MASGVKVDQVVKDMAGSFNNGPAKDEYAFLAFRIADDKSSIIWDKQESLTKIDAGMRTAKLKDDEKEEEENKRYAAFRQQLSLEVPRWYIYDCFKWIEGRNVTKVIWVHWCPDSVNIKQKMLYASSKDAFKKAVQANVMIECSDLDDIDHDCLLSRLK